MDKLHEECGIVGVSGHPDAANLAYLSLYAQQHRGQEACGIVSLKDDGLFNWEKGFGLVGDFFTKERLSHLEGSSAIGHNRYSTHGGRSMLNIQPFTFNTSVGSFAISHNGNLTNSEVLRKELEAEGSIFQSTSDTEVFMHLMAKSKKQDLIERLREVMARVKGAYSLVILHRDKIFAVRDPFGFRPLVLGKKDGAVIACSETCALDLIDAELMREVEPGEIVEIKRGQISSHYSAESQAHQRAFCSFEPIYFSRPDSIVFGEKIYMVRKQLGEQLAREDKVKPDVVIAVPDSGVPMAIGYARQANVPFEIGLVRNHYVGRTFIEPTQAIRDFGVKLKLNPVEQVLAGKKVLVVDDSLVRGTTAIKIMRMLRSAGAAEVHLRIASPPITHSCYFGVDTPERDQLLAAQKNVEQMCQYIGADTLSFLSLEGLKNVLSDQGSNKYCFGCFGAKYREAVFEKIKEAPTDAQGPGYSSLS